MRPPWEDGQGAVESSPEATDEERDGAFDPGVETGYLRRAPREGPPPVEVGARPFDPGPEIGIDRRRAKRARRQREREEQRSHEAEDRERREAEAAEEAERREAAERAAELAERQRREAEEHERRAAEEEAHERVERERLEAADRELLEAEERAVAEAERARREAAERDRREHEARRRALAGEAAERERREREAGERARRTKEAAERKRRQPAKRPARRPAPTPTRATAKPATPPAPPPRRAAEPRPQAPPPARPAAKPRRKATSRPPRPARPRPAPGLAGPTAKLVAALAAAVVGAILLGSALGLPTPLGDGKQSLAGALPGSPLDPGIAAALYRGPYHPVRGKYDYGEKDARFGVPRSGHIHEGQDIFSKKGTPLVAVRDGVVVDGESEHGRYSGGRGNYAVIYSAVEDRSFVYMHMLKPARVRMGDRVHAGEVIGLMGCTGSCFGTHLHFEVRRGKATLTADTKPIDPLPFLQDLPQAPDDLGKP